MGDDATGGDIFRELHDGVACAAEFEGADALEDFTLEEQGATGELVEEAAGHHRCGVNVWFDALCGLADVVEIDGRGGCVGHGRVVCGQECHGE